MLRNEINLFRALLLAILTCSTAHAASNAHMTPAGPSNPSGETITVHGVSPDSVRHAVEQVTTAPWYEQVSRWGAPPCPVVSGLPEPFYSIVIGHINRLSRLAFKGQEADCSKQNLLIFFTQNGTQTFNTVLHDDPFLGRGTDSSGLTRDDYALPDESDIRQLREDRPVRWYRAISTDPADGVIAILSRGSQASGPAKVLSDSIRGVFGHKRTQLRATYLIMIVDLPRSAGPTWGQLADYIAFASLTSPKLGDVFYKGSIMSLYNQDRFQQGAPRQLTSFDLATLQALYGADADLAAHDEQAEITHEVTSEIR